MYIVVDIAALTFSPREKIGTFAACEGDGIRNHVDLRTGTVYLTVRVRVEKWLYKSRAYNAVSLCTLRLTLHRSHMHLRDIRLDLRFNRVSFV